MNTTHLIILHNDCMFELWSVVYITNNTEWVLLSQFFSVTQMFYLTLKKKILRVRRWAPERTLSLGLWHESCVCHHDFISMHDRRLLRQPGTGDLCSLWYVVQDEAVWVETAKYRSCSFSSFLLNASNYDTISKNTARYEFKNLHMFSHRFTFTEHVGLTLMGDVFFKRWCPHLSPAHTKVNLVDASVSPTTGWPNCLSWARLGR